ncbi:MAG: hypothetical protein ACT4P4_07470 [Betaproteobacteria bacterium]
MEDVQFNEAFFRFLQSNIASVDAAEVLLTLYRNPDRDWSPADVLSRLGPVLSEGEVRKILDEFRTKGLVSESYRYLPASPELGAHVKTLALAYDERPVTLFRLIYALRQTGIQALAEAFRIRRG